jgi:hypothetical protein
MATSRKRGHKERVERAHVEDDLDPINDVMTL